MSEEINKIFEQWKQFLSWCYENNDKTAEIHRDNLEKVMAYTRQLENIIKEVRGYIEKELSFNVVINGKENKIIGYNKAFDKILEILDKVGDIK